MISALVMAVVIGADTPLENAEDEARAQSLMREIRCVVCDSEPVSHSTADIAMDMRRQIRQQVDDGQSSADIRQFFKDRYGQYVLLRPPSDGVGMLIWLFPFALLVGVGGLLAARLFAKRRKELAPLDSE